jgi:alpha-tubulin suppressor-like RCC1 family protein
MAFSALHAGLNHACAVTGGAGYCWGSNTSGQLGDGTTTNSATPVLVGGALGGFTFTHVSPAGEHSRGVSGGQAYWWGANNQGQLGDGTTTPHLLPGAVSGGLAFSQVRAGGNGYTCGVTTSGVAHCWGLNNAGQLGDGTLTRRLAPVPVSGGLVFSGLSAGFAHVLAGAAAGAYAWGSNNAGQLGDGTTTARSTPVPVVWVAP